MRLLNRYLWMSTLQGILIAWVALVVLEFFFAFINEVGKTNALYSTAQAFIYLVYTIPGRFYEMFATATLIGTLLGLGNLASNSEFTAMRAAGISVRQIVFSVLKLGALLAIGIFIVGEWLVPFSDLHARNFKSHLSNKNIVLVGGEGLWVKENNSIFYISQIVSKERLSDISIYTFKNHYSDLESLMTIDNAVLTKSGWELNNVYTTTFESNRVNKAFNGNLFRKDFLSSYVLESTKADPEQLSSQTLNKIIEHQRANNLRSEKYEIIYWKRFSVPLSALVMLVLAMPFLFGSNRTGGAGQRVFLGIVFGIFFSLASRSANELGVVYGFPPVISAFLPSLIFFTGGVLFLGRIK